MAGKAGVYNNIVYVILQRFFTSYLCLIFCILKAIQGYD